MTKHTSQPDSSACIATQNKAQASGQTPAFHDSKPAERPETAAVVVTYNRKDLLLECLQALQKQTVACDILVIDNASTDGTGKALEPLIESGAIHYIAMEKNLGGAGGFNKALRCGTEMGYKYLWAMDDDCIPRADALEALLAFAETHPDFGFLSSKVLWMDGSPCKMNEPKLIQTPLDTIHPAPCRQASFVSFFTRADVVRKTGLPILEFFIWGDDVEYTRRLSSSYPCWFIPQSVVVHKTASNHGSDISRDDADRIGRYRYAYRNEVCIARNEGGMRIVYQGAKVIYHTLRTLVFAPDHKKERLAMIWSATKEGLSFCPKKETL